MKSIIANPCNYLAGAVLLTFAAALPAHADNYQTAVLSQNPVGYWRLDETMAPVPPASMVAADSGSLGTAANGQPIDVVQGAPGAIVSDSPNLSCLMPGAADNRVRIPYEPQWNSSGPFSVEFWAKPDDMVDTICPAASVQFFTNATPLRNGWLFYQVGQGWSFRMYYNGSAGNLFAEAVTNMTLSTSNWYHIVGVCDGVDTLTLYVNGVLSATGTASGAFRPNTNSTIPLTFGARADGVEGYFPYVGFIDEPAIYDSALTAVQVLAHYQAGTNATPAKPYYEVILADNPAGYWRLDEAGTPAADLGTLGVDAIGSYVYDAMPGQPGPAAPTFPGFDSTNKAVSFNGTSGYVSLPPLNLDTNTVTITAWVNPTGSQNMRAGIVVSDAATTDAGITIDETGGLGVSYNWNGDQSAWAWDSFLTLSDSVWNFVALVVQPTEADLYVVDSNNASDFTGATNYITHAVQNFEGATLIGADSGETNFNGSIAQVAIFNRALREGEVYTEYAAAVGGLKPQIFANPSAPAGTIFDGDTVALSVDAGGTPPLTYQWLDGTTPVPNATNSTLTQVFHVADAGKYSVSVGNAYGTVTSGAAAISVTALVSPSIVQGPVSRTLYPGATLNLSVTALGGALSYQWQFNQTNIPGATTNSFQITDITAAAAGTYNVIVTNRAGTTNFGPVKITVPTPATGSYEAAVVADTPEAWWRLDELPGSTNMWDSLGRHDGIYTNGSGSPVTLGVPGALANDSDTAASFDGSSASYGVVPYSAAINPPVGTIECWANANAGLNSGAALSSQFGGKGWWFAPIQGPPSSLNVSEWSIDYGMTSSSYYYTPDTNANTAGALGLGWTYLVAVYSQGFVTLYINGYTDGTSWGGFDLNNVGPLLVGALGESSGTAPGDLFNGQVDEVAIYSTELSSNQIQTHFRARYGANSKPIFVIPLVSQVVGAGTPISFSTVAQGSLPISLQWEKNGVPVSGATNGTLTFANTVLSDTATYQLVATNNVGSTSVSVSLVVLPPPTFANVTNNLVLHLRFDGNYTDSSGQGNNGTAKGSPTFVPGIIGSDALHYSTTTDTGVSGGTVTSASYVSLGSPADLNLGTLWTNGGSFSVAFWIRLPAGYAAGDLPFFGSALDSNNDLGFTFSPSYDLGGWQWCLDSDATTGSGDIDVNGPNNSINDGNWHHLAMTFDATNTTAATYLDGLLAQTNSLAGLGDFDSGSAVTIGQDPTGLYPEPGSADIDDLAVWQAVLTPLDVATIYGAGVNAGASFDSVGRPELGLVRSGNNLLFVWQGGTLLGASSLDGPWSPVPGATAPTATVTAGAGTKFYRVQM